MMRRGYSSRCSPIFKTTIPPCLSGGASANRILVVLALVILTTKPCTLSPMMVRTFLWATVSTTVPGSSPVNELISDSTLSEVGCFLESRGQARRSQETSRGVDAQEGWIAMKQTVRSQRLRHPVSASSSALRHCSVGLRDYKEALCY